MSDTLAVATKLTSTVQSPGILKFRPSTVNVEPFFNLEKLYRAVVHGRHKRLDGKISRVFTLFIPWKNCSIQGEEGRSILFCSSR